MMDFRSLFVNIVQRMTPPALLYVMLFGISSFDSELSISLYYNKLRERVIIPVYHQPLLSRLKQPFLF